MKQVKVNINSVKLHKGQFNIFKELEKTKDIEKLSFITICCPRGWGKSILISQLILYFALNNANVRCMYIAPTIKQNEEIYIDVLSKLKIIGAIDKSNSQSKLITITNGSSINFRSIQVPENIRGSHVEYLFLDEAGLYKDDVFQSVLRPTLQPTGRMCILTSTPKGKNFFYQLFKLGENGEPGYYSFRGSNEDNPYTNWKEIEDARKQLPKKIFEAEYESVFADDGGEVFSYIGECATIKSFNPSNKRCFAGIDIGRADDFTSLTIIDEDYNVVLCHKIRQKEWTLIVNEVVTLLKSYNVRSCFVETNGVGDPIFEMIKKQFPNTEPFTTSNSSKSEIIENLIILFEDKKIKIPTKELFPDLYSELELFTFYYNKQSRTIRYCARTGHDDCVMSLAFAAHSLKKNISKGSYYISVI